MEKTRKIRFILEATVEQETAFTPEAVRRILQYSNLESFINSDEWQQIIRQNQVMLDTILADPGMVLLLLLQDLQARMVDEPMLIFRLAGYDTGKKTWPGFDALESLVPAMPAHARGFFPGNEMRRPLPGTHRVGQRFDRNDDYLGSGRGSQLRRHGPIKKARLRLRSRAFFFQ